MAMHARIEPMPGSAAQQVLTVAAVLHMPFASLLYHAHSLDSGRHTAAAVICYGMQLFLVMGNFDNNSVEYLQLSF